MNTANQTMKSTGFAFNGHHVNDSDLINKQWRHDQLLKICQQSVSLQKRIDDVTVSGESISEMMLTIAQGIALQYQHKDFSTFDYATRLTQGKTNASIFKAEVDSVLLEYSGNTGFNPALSSLMHNNKPKSSHLASTISRLAKNVFEQGVNLIEVSPTTGRLLITKMSEAIAAGKKLKEDADKAAELQGNLAIEKQKLGTPEGKLEYMKQAWFESLKAIAAKCHTREQFVAVCLGTNNNDDDIKGTGRANAMTALLKRSTAASVLTSLEADSALEAWGTAVENIEKGVVEDQSSKVEEITLDLPKVGSSLENEDEDEEVI